MGLSIRDRRSQCSQPYARFGRSLGSVLDSEGGDHRPSQRCFDVSHQVGVRCVRLQHLVSNTHPVQRIRPASLRRPYAAEVSCGAPRSGSAPFLPIGLPARSCMDLSRLAGATHAGSEQIPRQRHGAVGGWERVPHPTPTRSPGAQWAGSCLRARGFAGWDGMPRSFQAIVLPFLGLLRWAMRSRSSCRALAPL